MTFATNSSRSTNDLSGQTIKDRYTLNRRLGGGGFGDVYEAGDAMFPEVKRAVKIDKREDSESRFKKEARLIALSAHSAVVKVIDYGTFTLAGVDRGFLVMEYLEGETLEEHLQIIKRTDVDARLSMADLLVNELGSAIGHIHSQGVVHRDLKPSNIFIENRLIGGETSRTLKLIDFGTTRHFDINKTLGRVDIGISYPYSPPEVFDDEDDQHLNEDAPTAAGSKKENRWDIYSFGAILYEVLSGYQLYDDSGTATPPKITELIRRTESQAPKSLREFPHIGDKLPPSLDALILKCLAKNPARRPQTMKEFVDEYHAIRAPVRVRDDETPSSALWLKLVSAALVAASVFVAYLGYTGKLPLRRPTLAPPAMRTNPESKVEIVEGREQRITVSLHNLMEPGAGEPNVAVPREAIRITGLPKGITTEIEPAPTHEHTYNVKLTADLNFFREDVSQTYEVSLTAEIPSGPSEEPLILTKELQLEVVPIEVWLPPPENLGRSGYVFTPQRPYQLLNDRAFSETLVLVDANQTPLAEFKLVTAKDPFYMMRTKVSNGLYSRFLSASGVSTALDDDYARTEFSIQEAFMFCRWLAGSRATLPSIEQWLTAAGREAASQKSDGPCRLKPEDDAAYSKIANYRVSDFDYATSPFGIRQMGINGDEATRSFDWDEPVGDTKDCPKEPPQAKQIRLDSLGRLRLNGVSELCLNFWLVQNSPDLKFSEMNTSAFATEFANPCYMAYDKPFKPDDNFTFRVVVLCGNESGDPENW